MRQSSRIIHERILERLDHFFVSTATIQEPVEGRDEAGQPLPHWADIDGLVDVPCRIRPTTGREHTLIERTYVELSHRIALKGVFSQITPKHRAIVEGITYNIRSMQPDSQGLITYLGVSIIR